MTGEKRGPETRPMPEDFAALAETMTKRALQRHYSAGAFTVQRWLAAMGRPPIRRPGKPAPDDFTETAPKHTRYELAALYGVSGKVIERWLTTTGATPVSNIYRKPLPDDFAELAKTMCRSDLQRHYGCSWDLLSRWIRENRIEPAKYIAPPASPRIAYRKPSANYWRRPGTPQVQGLKNYSPEDEAADILRRYGPVYRCDERGRASEKGSSWRVGNIVVDGAELLARADRKRSVAA